MSRYLCASAIALAAALATAGPFRAQTAAPAQNATAQAFASENAILDTSIPFAIGAREARQELRGAFGWPTFQEGLVENVYFRFDPDGYARFAPTPRLDSDVFEVICRPRTYSCMGRKGSMSVMLNARGQLQIKLDNVVEGDSLFIVDGVTEIQLPARVLQPLDLKLETLLASGGELKLQRAENEVDRTSLIGFAAVAAYLRWVNARQDYTVLPRGWPVPNSDGGVDQAGLTQPQNWQSPMPQPQQIAAQPYAAGGAQLSPQYSAAQGPASPVQNEVAEVRGELNVLRQLLLDRSREPSQMGPGAPGATTGARPGVAPMDPKAAKIAEVETALAQITQTLHALRSGGAAPSAAAHDPAAPAQQVAPAPADATQSATAMLFGQAAAPSAPGQPAQAAAPSAGDAAPEQAEMIKRLQYLMFEIGLDAETAFTLVQRKLQSETQTVAAPAAPVAAGGQGQDAVVTEILRELQAQIPQAEAAPVADQQSAEASNPPAGGAQPAAPARVIPLPVASQQPHQAPMTTLQAYPAQQAQRPVMRPQTPQPVAQYGAPVVAAPGYGLPGGVVQTPRQAPMTAYPAARTPVMAGQVAAPVTLTGGQQFSPQPARPYAATQAVAAAPLADGEYLLLSEYFRSVFSPQSDPLRQR